MLKTQEHIHIISSYILSISPLLQTYQYVLNTLITSTELIRSDNLKIQITLVEKHVCSAGMPSTSSTSVKVRCYLGPSFVKLHQD